MKLTIDNKQRLMTGFLVFIELYKMLMGSFLVIFVPQKCNGLTCTASQTLFRGGLLNMTGTVCNFVTFTSIGTMYFIELKVFLLLLSFLNLLILSITIILISLKLYYSFIQLIREKIIGCTIKFDD